LFFTVILANLYLILYYIYRREKISKRYPSMKVKNSPSLCLHGHFLTVPFRCWEEFVGQRGGALTQKSDENAPERPSSTVPVIPSRASFATCLIVSVQQEMQYRKDDFESYNTMRHWSRVYFSTILFHCSTKSHRKFKLIPEINSKFIPSYAMCFNSKAWLNAQRHKIIVVFYIIHYG
jgi:hypothetical protein